MKFSILFLLLVFLKTAQCKEVAITFDDSPRFAHGYLKGPTRAKLLIEGLQKANVKQVAFFSVSSHLDSEGLSRLQNYAKAGHIIANHTHSHPDFNQTDLATYIKDFQTADNRLSQITPFERWFRFPFLREGNSKEKRDGMRAAMQQSGYKNRYITINNYDWYMESQFQDAIRKNPSLDLEKFKHYYVKTLINTANYYDNMAKKHLGRSPRHILLLHETDTNALFITDLVRSLENQGWKIITPHEAYQDEIAAYQTESLFKYNPGRIGEIASDKGQTEGLWHESCNEKYLDSEFKKQVLESF